MADNASHCCLTLASKPSELEGLCERVLDAVQSHGYSADDVFAVHLALEEAFLNAVRHGNKMDPSKTVEVDYCVDPEKIRISIRDQGSGFRPEAVPDPRVGENLYRPDGRGLLLMDAYMDEVTYNAEGNCVVMVRYRQRPR